MDIASLSPVLSQINTQSQVGVALLSKALDTQEEMGAEMIKMMEQSVTPHLGMNFDVSV
ncbi:MAG: YjfB family protein [Lachnospiraceae bacterium]|nr:YjfB family protein [Lachnospiraceae bacterium]